MGQLIGDGEADLALVTVVVTPRERFRTAPTCVRGIIASADRPLRMVVVDGGSPAAVADELRRLAEEHGFILERRDGFLTPNQARNIGLRRVETPYVLFVDNDVAFRPGWLGALMDCATETGAGLVTPVVLQGDPTRWEQLPVHFAGGSMAVTPSPAGRRFLHRYDFEGMPYAEAAPLIDRRQTGCIEFHCVLARSDLLRRLGGFDEALLATSEHFDLCLSALAAGETIMVEPGAVAINDVTLPLDAAERRYFCLRWSRRWCGASEARFQEKWDLVGTMESMGAFARDHRLYGFPFRRWARAVGWRPMVLLVNVLSEAIALSVVAGWTLPARR